MGSYYSSNPKFYVGIDCIIFGFNEGELNLLLLKRNFEPAMGNWSLMGGFVQESESVDDGINCRYDYRSHPLGRKSIL